MIFCSRCGFNITTNKENHSPTCSAILPLEDRYPKGVIYSSDSEQCSSDSSSEGYSSSSSSCVEIMQHKRVPTVKRKILGTKRSRDNSGVTNRTKRSYRSTKAPDRYEPTTVPEDDFDEGYSSGSEQTSLDKTSSGVEDKASSSDEADYLNGLEGSSHFRNDVSLMNKIVQNSHTQCNICDGWFSYRSFLRHIHQCFSKHPLFMTFASKDPSYYKEVLVCNYCPSKIKADAVVLGRISLCSANEHLSILNEAVANFATFESGLHSSHMCLHCNKLTGIRFIIGKHKLWTCSSQCLFTQIMAINKLTKKSTKFNKSMLKALLK